MKTTRLELKLPEELRDHLRLVSQKCDLKPEQIALQALRYYLPILESGLHQELASWDRLSDEALVNFEKTLETD
ncbi:MAG: hypothetical protein NZ610_03250 [Candidatus Bipolaricaulota bacterium]|nr:hypothetical protein [Candidatus Bipolaricaulota bacterium]MCS7274408.1 hypothetical protein [Candidatus Bipolaricaulota bacterium]MDW8110248.1 hypothetical protein [Candidatus Bipolaricaulota bacterium]MDW8328852.1 hypothetical protein [Candidatus Bipolaricaulota bacterium]